MKDARNPQFYEVLKTYVSDVARIIRSHYSGGPGLPVRLVQRARITDGGMATDFISEIDWNGVLANHQDEFVRLASYLAVANAMRSDPRIARHLDTLVGDGQWALRVNIDNCLRLLLLRLFSGNGEASFEEARFHAIYSEAEDYFYSDVLRRRIVAPLTDFNMEAETIPLEDELSIVRLSTTEREEFASQLMVLTPFPLDTLGPTGWEEFAIVLYAEVPKVFGALTARVLGGGLRETTAPKVEEVIHALRLFKVGGVEYDSINFRSIIWEPHGSGGFTLKRRGALGPRYGLSEDEIPDFLSFWRGYRRQRTRGSPRIELALRRFNMTYERPLSEDRLIDHVIALEALLLEGEPQELGYRLALRGSALLGDDSDSRFEVFTRLRKAYSTRSSIVHGDAAPQKISIGQTSFALAQFVDEIAGYVRRAIKKMMLLTEGTNHESVLASLDEQIARGMRS